MIMETNQAGLCFSNLAFSGFFRALMMTVVITTATAVPTAYWYFFVMIQPTTATILASMNSSLPLEMCCHLHLPK